MILPVHQHRRAAHRRDRRPPLRPAADDPAIADIVVEMPPSRALGDLAVPVAFELARRLRKAPRAIAQEIAAALGPIEGVAADRGRAERLPQLLPRSRRLLALDATGWRGGPRRRRQRPEKTIVEHTAINPNKAAHIGHLRNAALGDAFGRLLRFLGREVEIQNYIDDTGVQVADVVVGFRELEHKTLDDVRAIADSTRFDYYCWDLYARVTEWYEDDKERLKIRSAALHAIEHGGNDTAAMAAFIADRIVRCHLRTMARLNIGYDLLTWEGDILRLHFWAHAFEFLKKTGAVYLQTEGKLAGCWVMKIEDDAKRAAEGKRKRRRKTEEDEEDSARKVIVRSDGTVTYVGKDMAYQMWKFGLLGKDFHYRVFATRRRGGDALVDDVGAPTAANAAPRRSGARDGSATSSTRGRRTCRSCSSRRSRRSASREQARRSIHYSYEMVALSHATARELGYDASETPTSRSSRCPAARGSASRPTT